MASVISMIVFATGLALVLPDNGQAAVVRSNGKGGGLWSVPATWEGGKVPAGEAVVVLGNDIVDVDAATLQIRCEELTIDQQGALRIVGQDKTLVTFFLKNGLNIFGGMIVDFSKAPAGRCEFQWPATEGGTPALVLNEGCQVLWKGAANQSNVAFRVVPPTNAPPVLVPMTLGAKMRIECESVLLEGFDIQATGMDGSGLKYNEACSFRQCQLIRSSVAFLSCTKIEFTGNRLQKSPAHAIALNSSSHCRVVSNTVEYATVGIGTYLTTDTEYIGNTMRNCGEGMVHTATSDIFIIGNRFEQNQTGLMLNICTRVTGQRCVFVGNTWVGLRDAYPYAGVFEPSHFYDCVFQNTPTNTGTAALSIDGGYEPVDMVNTPLQTYLTNGVRSTLTFSAYVDILVTSEQNEPLGRVPLRILSGDKVIATSRTEAVGAMAGHTPRPSSHRPLIVPWHRYAPAEGISNPPPSLTYQLEVDGTTLGYAKQTVPLVMDAGFVRPDPDVPTKTVTVKLVKSK